MLRALFLFSLNLLTRLAEKIYQGEGVSTLLLIMPSQLVARTLSAYGATLGEDVRFRTPLYMHNAEAANAKRNTFFENLFVGAHSYFGRCVFLDLKDRIIVEERVTVAMRVMILTHTDVGNSPLKSTILPDSQSPVIIRAGAYIGAGAIILQGVEIGENAVVGAGAVVTGSIPAGAIAVGVPARVIKQNTMTPLMSPVPVAQM
jgi:acetyltransferase-like isoleucine patch superfamily enzyme